MDGRVVGSTLLLKAFRISREMQVTVKLFDTSFINSLPNHVLNDANHGSPFLEQNFKNDSRAAESFMDSAVSETDEMMRDTNKCHLPFFHKRFVYELFVKEFNRLYPSISAPTMPLFYRTWKIERRQVKVRAYSRFTKCGTCERLRFALASRYTCQQSTINVKDLYTSQRPRELSFIHPNTCPS